MLAALTWPEVTEQHVPVCCGGCGADLGAATVVGTEVRQVIDVAPVTVTVTDHVAEKRQCGCGKITAGTFPKAARAPLYWGPEVRALAIYLMDRQHLPVERAAELLADLVDAPVLTGWLCAIQLEAANKLAPFIDDLKDRLGAEPVVCADETGTRIGVTRQWAHTLTTGLLTLLVVHPDEGSRPSTTSGSCPTSPAPSCMTDSPPTTTWTKLPMRNAAPI